MKTNTLFLVLLTSTSTACLDLNGIDLDANEGVIEQPTTGTGGTTQPEPEVTPEAVSAPLMTCTPGQTFCMGIRVMRCNTQRVWVLDHVCPGDPNGTATCSQGTCGVTCNPGYDDCDRNGTCTSLSDDEENCGGCGISCGGQLCVLGTCGVCLPNNSYCQDGVWFECGYDGQWKLPMACPTMPNGSGVCIEVLGGIIDSMCGNVCNPGFADCNQNIQDGCETELEPGENCPEV